jgi:hypothetical protein
MTIDTALNVDIHDPSCLLAIIKKRQIEKDIINQLDIADGLKELLIGRGFTLDLLTKIKPNDLAKTLGIDDHIAKIITIAAKKQVQNLVQ